MARQAVAAHEAEKRLAILDDRVRDVAARVGPHVPCTRGCADCCRNLGEVPEISDPEWERLEEAVRALEDGEELFGMLAALDVEMPGSGQAMRLACPLLSSEGACRVYAARPLKCRSFGHYVGREGGRYCEEIASMSAELDPRVVWGNYDALEHEARRALGPSRSIAARAREASRARR